MALDRRKGLQTAERLLKQGKLQAALSELQRVSESAPNDLLTLNRLGDLLARQGRRDDAIGYYDTIAERFAQGGFLPKSIAMHKKILRLDPQRLSSMVALGGLYLRQRLPGEARSYLLHAATQYLQAREFVSARDVYEQLVEAEPDDPRHRVRLAETRAAAGEPQQAALALVDLGRSLLDAGETIEARKTFERARELHPAAADPVLGLVACLGREGDPAGATALLEQACEVPDPSPALVGELAARQAHDGRIDHAIARLRSVPVAEIPTTTWQGFFRACLAKGASDQVWESLGPMFDVDPATGDSAPVVSILESLGELETQGHVPALRRLLALQKRRGDSQGAEHAAEWLVRAYQDRAMHDEASLMMDELRAMGSDSPLLGGTAPPQVSVAVPVDAPTAAAVDTPAIVLTADVGELPEEFAAPAVPLNKADQEFVAGRVTQAEVLEKYGLRQQALDQLDEVAAKFPGHVCAMQRRVEMIRQGGEDTVLPDALAQAALALRAAGETESALEAAREASGHAGLEMMYRQALAQAGLLAVVSAPRAEQATTLTAPAAVEVDLLADFDAQDPSAAPTPVASLPSEPLVVPTAHATPTAEPAPATPMAVAAPPAAPVVDPGEPETMAAAPTRSPSADMLEEIRGYLEQDAAVEAERRVAALRTLGYASAELDDIESEVRSRLAQLAATVTPPVEAVPPLDLSFDLDASELGVDDGDDLSAITAALEEELFDGESQPLVPEEDPEQSLDEVFATFKEHVQEQVGADDYQTHYDLGIAYKEMGMVDEAIEAFGLALASPVLKRDACTMIAVCRRELGSADQAVDWYRQAIEAAGDDPPTVCGLRYDLAEVLVEAGDAAGALDLFRDLLQANPGFRDVAGRVQELEATA